MIVARRGETREERLDEDGANAEDEQSAGYVVSAKADNDGFRPFTYNRTSLTAVQKQPRLYTVGVGAQP